jgi:hypothetical protein
LPITQRRPAGLTASLIASARSKEKLDKPKNRFTMSVLVGKKMMAKLAGQFNETEGSEVSAFAKKQMAKMGWKE